MVAQLRLWRGDGENHPPTPWESVHWDGARKVEDAVLDGREVHGGWRLVEFLRRYFGPAHLLGGEAPATEKTILGYWDAVRWACRVDRDPLLDEIGDGWLGQTLGRMRDARYRRGTQCVERGLASETRAKHGRQLRTLLKEAAWLGVIGPMRPAMRARRRSAAQRPGPKPAYTVAELRAIVARSESIPVKGFSGSRLRALWRSIYGLGFYTGLRREALLAVSWQCVQPVGEEQWLRVPATMAKDKEPWEGPIYPALWTELLQVYGESPAQSAALLPWPYEADWLTQRVKDAVAAAGIAGGRGRDLHGLRRSHEQVMLSSGFDLERQTAARLLNQSDPATTFGYYAQLGQLRAKYIRAMPAIW